MKEPWRDNGLMQSHKSAMMAQSRASAPRLDAEVFQGRTLPYLGCVTGINVVDHHAAIAQRTVQAIDAGRIQVPVAMLILHGLGDGGMPHNLNDACQGVVREFASVGPNW